MQTQEFSIVKANEIFREEESYDKEGKLKAPLKTQAYIAQYFFPTVDGNHYFWTGTTFKAYSQQSIKDVFMNRLPAPISKWFFKENPNIFKIINDMTKDRVHENSVNMWPGWKHKPQKYSTFSIKIQAHVERLLSYIRSVLASNNEEVYQYLLNWLANVCQGKKNDACIYLRGGEGIGKSTLTEFLKSHVLGDNITTELNNADSLTTAYNSILVGKVLIVFEELPTFSDSQWAAVSGKLKHMITGSTMIYSDKFEKAYSAGNINNYIINTNVEAIKHSEGRRYFTADVSTLFKGNQEYWDEIYENCFNDEVGHAFFNFLLERDTKAFKPQKMPDTQNKLNAIANRLCPVYQFLKMNHIKTNEGLNESLADAFVKYKKFCQAIDVKPLGKIGFGEKLREVNIIPYRSNATWRVKVSIIELRKIAISGKWIHAYDEIHPGKDVDTELDPKDAKIEEQAKEIESLKNQIKALQSLTITQLLQQEQAALHKGRRPLQKEATNYLFDEDFSPKVRPRKPKQLYRPDITITNIPDEVEKLDDLILDIFDTL